MLGYLKKAELRVRLLQGYVEGEGYSDVVCEAQEAVELALRAALRLIGVERLQKCTT